MGRLIPAGTGRKAYAGLRVSDEELQGLEEEVAARKAAEEEEAMAAMASKAEKPTSSIMEDSKTIFDDIDETELSEAEALSPSGGDAESD